MAKRAFIVHRWGGSPQSDWYPWLAKMLKDKGFEVFVPEMPNTNEPHISSWVNYLSKAIGNADGDTYLIGHSIGCQTILRYLESLKGDTKIGGAFFAAGWLHLKEGSLETDEEINIADEWTNSPIDLSSAKRHINRSVACFSDNDPFVLVSESSIFEKELGSKIILHPKRGHFTSEHGVLELHVALNEILKMARD
jgi:uncharacterized protein